MPRQAVALFRSALIGALDLASDVNSQTKCPLRKKMHEAMQRVETNFTARPAWVNSTGIAYVPGRTGGS